MATVDRHTATWTPAARGADPDAVVTVVYAASRVPVLVIVKLSVFVVAPAENAPAGDEVTALPAVMDPAATTVAACVVVSDQNASVPPGVPDSVRATTAAMAPQAIHHGFV